MPLLKVNERLFAKGPTDVGLKVTLRVQVPEALNDVEQEPPVPGYVPPVKLKGGRMFALTAVALISPLFVIVRVALELLFIFSEPMLNGTVCEKDMVAGSKLVA